MAINGFDSLNVTKLDVLSGLGELKVGVAYRDPSTGLMLDAMPADLGVLGRVEVVYETLAGWEEDISGARVWADLPPAAQAYVRRMEALVGVPCRYIGVGPGRDAVVIHDSSAK